MYVCSMYKILMTIWLFILIETMICLSESSLYIVEEQASVVTLSLNLTNPLSVDIMVIIVTTDGTAAGEDITILSLS